MASWYGGKFQGRKTANGEIFDTHELTAAHKTLPFNTLIIVKNMSNGKEVVVRINDRGPFVDDRIIDLSHEAALQIDMIQSGTASVKLISVNPDLVVEKREGPPTIDIQVGSYSDLENAMRMKNKLTLAGFSPQAELSNQGTTRILLKNITQEKVEGIIQALESLGIRGVLIKQNF